MPAKSCACSASMIVIAEDLGSGVRLPARGDRPSMLTGQSLLEKLVMYIMLEVLVTKQLQVRKTCPPPRGLRRTDRGGRGGRMEGEKRACVLVSVSVKAQAARGEEGGERGEQMRGW